MLTACLPSPRYLAGLVVACLLAVPAAAATITLSHAGSALAGGSIGGVAFGPTDFVITAVGDTNNREDFGFGYALAHRSASIAIDGVGSFDFVDPTRTFVNNDVQGVGFGSPVGDLFDGPLNTAFASYGLDTSIGPISGRGEIIQWGLLNITTSGGTLLLTSSPDVPASFEANVAPIPLPAGGLLLLTALAGVPMLRHQRRLLGLFRALPRSGAV